MKKVLVSLISSALLLLTGCSEDTVGSEQSTPTNTITTTESTSEYDPFAKPQKDENAGGMVGSFTLGVNWQDNKQFTLDYAPTVSFEHFVVNDAKNTDFGLLIFVNGFSQPYRTEDVPENKNLHIFDVNEKSQKTQRIEFEPIVGELGEEVSVEIITMYRPSFIQKEKSNYVFEHRIHSLSPSTMAITEETGLTEPDVCNSYNEEPINDELRQKFNTVNSTGGYGGNSLDERVFIQTLKNDTFYTPADMRESEFDMSPFTMDDTVTLCMYGKEPCKYRVSMYINHELVKGAFDGADYIDMEVSSDSISKKQIDLNALNLSLDDYNHLYFVAVPFYTNKNYGERMVMKSDTVTLVDVE